MERRTKGPGEAGTTPPGHIRSLMLNFNECKKWPGLGGCHAGVWSISFCRRKLGAYYYLSFPPGQVPSTELTSGNQKAFMVLLHYLLLPKASLRAIDLCWERLPGWRLCLWERRGSGRRGSAALETRRTLVPGASVSFFSSLSFIYFSFFLLSSFLPSSLHPFLLPTISPSIPPPSFSRSSQPPPSSLPPPGLPVPGPQVWEAEGGSRQGPLHQQQQPLTELLLGPSSSELAGPEILAGTTFPTPGKTMASWSWKMPLPPGSLGLLTPRNHWAEKGVRPLAGVTNPGNPGETVNRAARTASGTCS